MATNNGALPYDQRIANFVREKERAGVSRTKIFHAVQKFQNAPRSLTTFYKLYRDDMEEVHAEVAEKIGNVVVEQAIKGDFKAAEFFLRSKGGWSPSSTENVVIDDDKDVDTTAFDKLLRLLGKS